MRIESNIAGVIRQTERLIANVPGAMQAALRPELWRDLAREAAESILKAVALPTEVRHIPIFLGSLTAMFEGGLVLRMGGVGLMGRIGGVSIEQAQAAFAATKNADAGMGLFDLPVREFEDLILRWVETREEDGGKRRDARDADKPDEDIARLISYIMLSPNLGEKGKAAREKLTPHIAAFLKQQGTSGLAPEVVDFWLRSVLAGWREMMRLHYPGRVREVLLSQKGELL